MDKIRILFILLKYFCNKFSFVHMIFYAFNLLIILVSLTGKHDNIPLLCIVYAVADCVLSVWHNNVFSASSNRELSSVTTDKSLYLPDISPIS